MTLEQIEANIASTPEANRAVARAILEFMRDMNLSADDRALVAMAATDMQNFMMRIDALMILAGKGTKMTNIAIAALLKAREAGLEESDNSV